MRKRSFNRRYLCPYCGREYEDDKWSFDHIIPLEIGGPRKFKVVSCVDCNNRIGQQIEQPTIRSWAVRSLIIEMDERRFRIRTRRKENFIPIFRKGGIVLTKSGIMALAGILYSRNEKATCIDIKGLLGHASLVELKNSLSSGMAIFREEKDTPKEKVAFGSLASKIILGTCHWIWGGKFSKSVYGDDLRKAMWENRQDHMIELDALDHHLVWTEGDSPVARKPELVGEDTLNNSPDHTIYLFNYQDVILGLVNLFGELESMVRVGKVAFPSTFDLDEKGLILIASATRNEVLKMNFGEYEEYRCNL